MIFLERIRYGNNYENTSFFLDMRNKDGIVYLFNR